jgi:hypothetical protein
MFCYVQIYHALLQVTAGLAIAGQIDASLRKESLIAAEAEQQFLTYSTAFFSLSIATSLMTCLLTAVRIINVQRATASAGLESESTYRYTIEVVVESAATYSVTLLVFIIILTRHDNPTSQYFAQSVHAQFAVSGLSCIL